MVAVRVGLRRSLLAALVFLAVVPATVGGPALAGSFERDAAAFIENLTDLAIRQLTPGDLSRRERTERFRRLFNRHFAVAAIGKWVLGRHWPKATEAERREYMDLFEDLIVVSYVNRFADYSGEALNITRTLSRDGRTATVFSELANPESDTPARVNWRVGLVEGRFLVFDVTAEGTSMSNTLRSDFGSIIRQRGGKVAGLLDALRDKTASLRAAE